MASKGPKSDAPAVTPPVSPVLKSSMPQTLETALPQAAKPASKKAGNPAPAPVTSTVPVQAPAPVKPAGTKPVAARSTPVAPQPVLPQPGLAQSVSPQPAPAAPAAVITAPPQPVSTPTAPRPAAPEPVAATAASVLHKEVTNMNATINSATDAFAADKVESQAKSLFGDVNDRAKSALEKGSKLIEDLNDFSKGNIEAVVQSSKIAAKGAEDIARYTNDYVRATVEKANSSASQYAAVKSPTEFFKLHSELAKDALDSLISETAKFTEGYVKLLGEIAQPLSNRVAVAAEKIKVAA